MRTLRRPCKRCTVPFDQPLIQGRPRQYCSYLCKDRANRESRARLLRERHQALRAAGVPPTMARIASHGQARFERALKEQASVTNQEGLR